MQVLHMTDHNKPAWDMLHWATCTGDLAFEHTHKGLSEFEWLKANPAEEDKFSKAMKEVDSLGEACTPPSCHKHRSDRNTAGVAAELKT